MVCEQDIIALIMDIFLFCHGMEIVVAILIMVIVKMRLYVYCNLDPQQYLGNQWMTFHETYTEYIWLL